MRPHNTFFELGLAGESFLNAFKKFKHENVLKVTKAIQIYKKDQEAKVLTNHFCEFFESSLANTEEQFTKCFRIRHEVYCEEMSYLPICENSLEKTPTDDHSLHCTIQHKRSQHFAGTVRLVYTDNKQQTLPVEQFCEQGIWDTAYHPDAFPRDQICEISRLAVPASFRRRKMDKFKNAATGGINEYEYSEQEMRCFPFVAIGLYLAAGAAALKSNKPHVFVMMEPRLARNMQFVGITFKQIGETVSYHGKRAPYYINAHDFKRQLKPGFKQMLGNIDKQLYQS